MKENHLWKLVALITVVTTLAVVGGCEDCGDDSSVESEQVENQRTPDPGGDHDHDDHDHGDHGHDHDHDDHDHGDHDRDHGDHGHDHDHGDHDHDHDDHDHDHGDHDHDHGDHDHGEHGAIHFPGDYQQKVGFQIEKATPRRLRPSLEVQARVRPTSGGEATATAPFEGEVSAPQGGIPDVGSRVAAGQILAEITPRVAPAERVSIETDLERARVQRTQAKREVERLSPLAASGATPQRRLDDAESELAVAEAQLKAARERHRQFDAVTDRGGTGRIAVRSPIDGVVVRRSVVDGGFVTTGAKLMEVVDRSTLWLEARVPEASLDDFSEPEGAWFFAGDAGVVDLQAGDNSRLVNLGEIIDPKTRTASVIFEMVDPPASIRVGQSLRANLYGPESHKVLSVQRTAVLEEEGVDVVFVPTGAESFERRAVKTGMTDGEYVEILSGLQPGEPVVVRGSYHVRLAAAATGEIGHGHSH